MASLNEQQRRSYLADLMAGQDDPENQAVMDSIPLSSLMQGGQIPGSFGSGQGAFQRSGGNRIDLTPQGWQDTQTNQMVAPASNQPNQDAQLDYASPLDYMGTKGYRVKGNPSMVVLNDGRMVNLNPGDVAGQQAAAQKAQMAALDMEAKRLGNEKARGDLNIQDWHIDSASGVMVNKRNGEIRQIPQQGGGSGGVVPGNNDERLAAGYGQRMALADQLMSQIGPEGYQTTGRAVAESVPLIGGYLGRKVGTEKQGEFSQAQADWVRAKLRKESGAAIGADEMSKEITTYFPMPGDTPGVIAQKSQARQIANEAMKMAAGRAGGAITGVRPGAATQSPSQLMKEAEQAIARGAPREAVMQRLQEHLKGK